MAMRISGELKEQGKAILVMMGLAIVAVLAMLVLNQFVPVIHTFTGLLNASPGATNYNTTIVATLNLFVTAFALFGSFASITALIILVKAIIGIVRGLN